MNTFAGAGMIVEAYHINQKKSKKMSDNKYKMFKNFMFNELGITKYVTDNGSHQWWSKSVFVITTGNSLMVCWTKNGEFFL